MKELMLTSAPDEASSVTLTPNLVRLHLGELVPRLQGERPAESESRGIVHGLPGCVYPMEASGDLEHWQSAGEVRLTGYDREARFTLPAPAEGNRFLRLKSPRP
jgi:hypothetical protein